MNIDKNELRKKLDLVIDKLLNLGGPENEEELKSGGEAIGFFKRDFGIKEWDWPQGVGIYGLLKIMQYDKNIKYKEFLHGWFVHNIDQGLPSRNINTTTPPIIIISLLALAPLTIMIIPAIIKRQSKITETTSAKILALIQNPSPFSKRFDIKSNLFTIIYLIQYTR